MAMFTPSLARLPGSSHSAPPAGRGPGSGPGSGPSRSAAGDLPPGPTPARPKRSQVSRACNWCRVHRVKCDDGQPCHNCKSRGGQCITTASEVRTLPQAFREIERLKLRVRDLEHEIERRDRAAAAATIPTPSLSPGSASAALPTTSGTASSALALDQLRQVRTESALDHVSSQGGPPGIYTSNGQMPQKQWFGPSSLFYFIDRMTSHLGTFLDHPPSQHTIHFSLAASNSFAADASALEPSQASDQPLDAQEAAPGTNLTAMQEEYFLGFFWQSYHCSFQIVDEASFRELYKSLWTNTKTRKPSALVDIMLALCIQYDTACPARRDAGGRPGAGVDAKDTAMAGHWHYQKCQALLIPELESPTVSTLQCHIFSVIYLCCASFQNMAYSTLALAVRTAHILGLHLEPPRHLPRPVQELRKRLWWTLYALESKTCMKLGRPWSAPMSETTCSLPSDDHQLAIDAGYASLAGGNVSWLTYTVQNVKLVLAARRVYMDFHNECSRIRRTSTGDGSGIDDDPAVLERCATLLKSTKTCLDAWVQNVPDALKCQRKRGGEPLSTDGTELAMEAAFAPLWLQRQRLFLELLYHNLCMNLQRPFISFSPSLSGPAADECAAACVRHAMALTQIMHQALSETDLLRGWHEAFQWQWNASMTIIGFVLACPLSPLSAAARTAVGFAMESFEIFGRHFAVGTRAAKVVGELKAKAEMLVGSLQCSHVANSPSAAADASDGSWYANSRRSGDDAAAFAGQEGAFDGPGLQDVLNGTMDVAFSVDSSYNVFEVLDPNSLDLAGGWAFTSEYMERGTEPPSWQVWQVCRHVFLEKRGDL